jgi:hypothetical protein
MISRASFEITTGREERGCKGKETYGPSVIDTKIVIDQIPIPLFLANEKFISAWIEWIEYRLECGRAMRWPTNIRCFRKSMKLCEEMGVERSIAAIDYSIERSYRGLFERPRFETRRASKKVDKWDGL